MVTPYVFDMETGDPDDVLTLLWLISRRDVDLRAVTICPGSSEQVALVRWLLCECDHRHVRIGAREWPKFASKHGCINGNFYRAFGRDFGVDRVYGPPSHSHGHKRTKLPSPHADLDGKSELAVEAAATVLVECCTRNTVLVTGGPLHNLYQALQNPQFVLGRWVAQGGFAGEGVVPTDVQMDKFRGKTTMPTWNFNGCIEGALAALASKQILTRNLVSKNVCHRTRYDQAFHRALGQAARIADPSPRRSALALIHESMERYLARKPGGKALHDPLALAAALHPTVCTWAEVKVYKEDRRSKWGSVLSPGSGVFISIDYDDACFRQVLLTDGSKATTTATSTAEELVECKK